MLGGSPKNDNACIIWGNYRRFFKDTKCCEEVQLILNGGLCGTKVPDIILKSTTKNNCHCLAPS